MTPKIVYIEGNIGTGKSTFLKHLDDNELKKRYKYEVLYEPVDDWQEKGILEKFYKDPKRYCYTFQSYCLFTRFQLLKKIDRRDDLDFVFIERSIFSDNVIFAQTCKSINQMSELEYNIYISWFNHFFTIHPNDYYHLYLQLQPEICLERIKQRSRNEETGISIDYLKLLHDNHESWLNNNDKCIKVYDNRDILKPKVVLDEVSKLIGLYKVG
tara:strand:+ start:759 stop:1397 length:639 start_codon:yes stop_codon:yes gene_type:complete